MKAFKMPEERDAYEVERGWQLLAFGECFESTTFKNDSAYRIIYKPEEIFLKLPSSASDADELEQTKEE